MCTLKHFILNFSSLSFTIHNNLVNPQPSLFLFGLFLPRCLSTLANWYLKVSFQLTAVFNDPPKNNSKQVIEICLEECVTYVYVQTVLYAVCCMLYSDKLLCLFLLLATTPVPPANATTAPSRPCHFWEFTCVNGRCINNGYKCNDVDNCGDGSDERGCGKLYFVLKHTYFLLSNSENREQ